MCPLGRIIELVWTAADLRVLMRIIAKTVYSKTGEVTKAQSLYWIGFFGMYLRTGLALRANSMQFLCKQ